MAKKKKKRTPGKAQAAPTKADNQTAAEKARRKQFLRTIAKAERMVVFTGGGSVSHYGFKSDGDLLLFLQDQVYAHKGGDIAVYTNILQEIQKAQEQAAAEAADPDLEDVLGEMDEDEDDEAEEVEAKEEDDKVVPMKPKKKKTTNVPEKDEAALLRARLAELEGGDEDADEDDEDED
jgi:hypothetical protein